MLKYLAYIMIVFIICGTTYISIDRICDYKERKITEHMKILENNNEKLLYYNNGLAQGMNMLLKGTLP